MAARVRRWSWLLVIIALAYAFPYETDAQPEPPKDESQVKLAVIVVFDQFRGDYLARWEKQFVSDGFKRLTGEGAWYQNCHYPYAVTLTAAGHASISTGCSPNTHGIIANDWYDRPLGKNVSSVGTNRYQPIPLPANAKKDIEGAAPIRRRVGSVGDALLKGPNPKSKVVGLSIKDRSAILLAALRAQLCCWFSTSAGRFVTSTFYADSLPAWANQFNKRKQMDDRFGEPWTRLRPELDYDALSGPDEGSGESGGVSQGRTFPHAMTGGAKVPGKKYYEALTTTPFGNELLWAFAKEAIVAEKLGQRDAPDLLCLSFSCNDLVGHAWGPDSHEVLDTTLRTDLLMKDMLDFLDAKVGKGRYVMVMSADHGICPIPETAKKQGIAAGRLVTDVLKSGPAAHLQQTYGKPKEKPLPWIEEVSAPWIYLNRGVLKERKLDQAKVEQTLVDWLKKQPGIQTSYSRTQLLAGLPKDDVIGEQVRLSFDAERSGDVVAILKPYHLFGGPKANRTGTTHGSPHPYDTHVPLVIYGGGVIPGVRKDRVTPQATAAIIARALGVEPPPTAEAPLPKGLFK